MTSAIYVTFGEGEGIDAGDWRSFCAEHGIAHSPRTVGGNVWYAGDVEVTEEETSVTFSTYIEGPAMPEVARLARAFWLQFGGSVQAADELRGLFAAAERDAEPMEDEPAPAHDHQWAILGAQPHTPAVLFGKPVPHTIVLLRCTACGEPDSRMLPGEWTLAQLQQTASGLGLVAVENGGEDLSGKLTTTEDADG